MGMNTLLLIALVVMAGYGLLAGIVYLRQDSMLYYPVREISATPADIGLSFETVALRTADGITISAWFIPSERQRGALIFCHGNGGNISHRLDSIRIFHRLGLSVLIFDYRGYGGSEGSPGEEGTYLDASAAWHYLVAERQVRPEKIVFFGRSLGAAVAAEAALRHRAGALIMESGFTSVPDLGQALYPYLPVRLLAKHRYASIEKVSGIEMPKLFVHSPDDEIIPYSHGTALFAKAAEPKQMLTIRGGHNDGFLVSGELYLEGLERFLAAHLDGGT